METVQREQILMWLVIGLEVEITSNGKWVALPQKYYPVWIKALKDKCFYPVNGFRLRENW